jgi:NAD(P)H dehydrogenase (quinone)
MSRIAVIIGHSRQGTFCEALGEAYATGARSAGHEAVIVHTARIAFDPILREAYVREQPLEPQLADAHREIMAADHLVFVFPLWLGAMPAKGKSARVIMTMGMPGLVYRWWYGAHALQALKRNVLEFMGVAPVKSTLFGMVEAVGAEKRRQWLDDVEAMGRDVA